MKEAKAFDIEFVAADDEFELIPDTEYWAECTHYKLQNYDGKRMKLYLQFETFSKVSGEEIVSKVFMPFNMPVDGKVGTRSKYYKLWRMAHGAPPTRNAKLSPVIFKNKYCKIRTRTVKTFASGEDRPDDKWYSVVDDILLVVVEKRDKKTPTTHFDSEY